MLRYPYFYLVVFLMVCQNSDKHIISFAQNIFLISQWNTSFIFGGFSPIPIIKLQVLIIKARN